MKVLVVEDEVKIAQYLAQGLTQYGYSVDVVNDGKTGLFYASEYDYDLMVLDIMLPGLNGWEVLKRLRDKSIHIPTLILSACDETLDRVRGLDYGADDYLVKPFAFSELRARLQAIARRNYQQQATTYTHGKLHVDLLKREVAYGGEVIQLTAKEFAVLREFIEKPQELLTKIYLLERVWGADSEAESNVVDVTMYRLRKKLKSPNLIKNLRGVGYVFSPQT